MCRFVEICACLCLLLCNVTCVPADSAYRLLGYLSSGRVEVLIRACEHSFTCSCAVRGIQSRERFCHEGQALKASYVVSAAENGRNGEYCAGPGLSEDPKMNPRQCDATLLDDFDVHDARRDEELRVQSHSIAYFVFVPWEKSEVFVL